MSGKNLVNPDHYVRKGGDTTDQEQGKKLGQSRAARQPAPVANAGESPDRKEANDRWPRGGPASRREESREE